MASTPAPTQTEISTAFTFDVFESVKVVGAIQTNLVTLVGPQADISAEVVSGTQPRVTSRFDSLANWAEALNGSVQGAGRIYARSADYGRTIYINVDLRSAEVNVDATWRGGMPREVATAVDTVAGALGWRRQETNSASPHVRVESLFRLAKPGSHAWLVTSLAEAQALAPRGRFHGEAGIRSPREYVYKLRSPVEWQDQISRDWAITHRAGFDLYGGSTSISLECSFERGETRVTVESHTREAADRLLEEFTRQVGLSDQDLLGNSGLRPEGAGAQYFTKDPGDQKWLAAAVPVLLREVNPLRQFNGRYHTVESPDTAASIYSEAARWQQDVVDNWRNLDRIYGWFAGQRSTIVFDYNVRREIAKIEVQAASQKDAREILDRLATDLRLEAFQGRPYQYRRFMRVFQIVTWDDNVGLATAIREAFAKAFPRQHALVNASLAEGTDSETLSPYYALDRFLDGLQLPGKVYMGVQLTGEGPHGIALGITAERGEMKLTIKTNLERSAFNEVTSIFEREMDVKFLKEVKSEKAAEKAKSEGPWGKLLLAAAGLALSTAFISEAIPRYSVEITRPGKRGDKVTTISSPAVNVEWDVKKKQFWTERLVADAGGEVALYGPDDRQILRQPCPGTRCEIVFQQGPVGSYQIRVYVPQHSIASAPADFVSAPATPGTGGR